MVDNVVNEWRRDRLHNIEQLAEFAGEASGLGAEDLAAAMGRSARTRKLTATAAEAAATTTWPVKIVVLGKLLADGLIADDNAEIDIQQHAVDAMEDMERPHVALLDLLTRDPPNDEGWGEDTIAREEPQLAPVLAGLIGVLRVHGLIYDDQWIVTMFGQTVLDYFREAAAAAGTGASSRELR